MKRKEVEKILQDSADGIKLKDFSERWNEISDRLNMPEETSLMDPCDEAILVAAETVNVTRSTINRKLVYSLCAAFLLIVLTLAVVLPLTLKRNNEPLFLNLNELTNESVIEEEFYTQLENTDLEVVDFNKFNAENFNLLFSADNDLVGGKVDIVDESEGTYAVILFYGRNVTSEFEVGTDYKEYDVNGFKIVYNTELDEGVYKTQVKAEKNGTNYEFKCLGVNEEVESFFDKLFG